MNIWIIDHYSSEPQYGGIARQYDFAKGLSAKGHNVLVIASSFSHFFHKYISTDRCFCTEINERAHYAYVKTLPYQTNGGLSRLLNMLSFQPAIRRQYKKLVEKYGIPDIVVGSSIHPFVWTVSYKIAKKYRAKFFVEVRDLWPAYQIYDEGKSHLHPEVIVFGALEKWAYKKAQKVIYTMSRGDKYLCDEFGLPRDKVALIGQPLDCDRFDQNAKKYELLPQEMKTFISDSFLCVFTGYYKDYEGVNEMLDAAKILRDRGVSVKFVFVGNGSEEEKMKSFVEQNNLSDVVYLGGRISKELVPALIRRADVCLAHLAERGNPKSYQYDASKNKINEYMYSDSCIVYGTYVENQFVQMSGAGYTIEPFSAEAFADTIEKVYRMPEKERQQFGENARKYILSNNTLEILTDKYMSLFD